MDVRMFTVGMVQENCFLARRDGGDHAVIVDPGDEAEKLLGAIDALGVTLDAILLTHTHFDHVGAVAPMAKATGAPVYCPGLEREVLADIMRFVPWPGIGPFESYDADETVEGGERLQLAGMDIEVLHTPGHSPGHVTYAVQQEGALFSGDVLFQGSAIKALVGAVILFLFFSFLSKGTTTGGAITMSIVALVLYTPVMFATDKFIYQRKQKALTPKG